MPNNRLVLFCFRCADTIAHGFLSARQPRPTCFASRAGFDWGKRGGPNGDDVAGIVADLRALGDDPSRKDIAWRYGLEADVLDSTIRRAEFGNWLSTKVRPYAAAKA